MPVTKRVAPAAVMLDLPGFVVIAAGEVGGELEVLIEATETVTGCPRCGVVATAHVRRAHVVRDIPSAGGLVLLVWAKGAWRCDEPVCLQRTWSERNPAIRPKAALIERAWLWACGRVGEDGDTVEDVRLELGVGRGTVMARVRDYGQPLVDHPEPLTRVIGLGVDESAWLRANATRSTRYVTGIVALTPGRPARLLDVVDGQSGTVYAEWIAGREREWRDAIEFAALDPFRGYAAALRTDRAGARPLAGLDVGDSDGEVAAAWLCAQKLRDVYRAATPEQGDLFLRGWAGYFRYGNSAHAFDKIRGYALTRFALFIAKRHQRGRAWGFAQIYRSPNTLGLISLNGIVVPPRPNRAWPAPVERRR